MKDKEECIIRIIKVIKNEIAKLKEFWEFLMTDTHGECVLNIKGIEVIATFAEKPNKEILSRMKEILLGTSHIRQGDAPDIKLKKNIKEAV